MKDMNETVNKRPWLGWVLFSLTALCAVLAGALAYSIMQRKTEAQYAYRPAGEIKPLESRSSEWGKYYPREYQSFLKNADTSFFSKYNGNGTIDMLKVDPRLVMLFAGYAFSKDYKQSRGHYYAIYDMYLSLRPGAPKNAGDGPMPATCWTCKSPDVPRLMSEVGVENFYSGKWASRGHQVVNPIGCADCHDAKTMQLTLTRPALVEALQRMGKDTEKISHQEMRSLVCAQCHVEYYFKGDHKVLTFPWDSGMTVEKIEAYYDSYQFKDWEHPLSKAPMLKAQHPDYEVFQLGIHARRGVACADCHMPYKNEGGVKYTDHHVQSPLNNINNSCQVCHRESEDELRQNVFERQDKVIEIRDSLEILLVRAHVEAKTAWEKGATPQEMEPVLKAIRKAQWRWDFSAAGHGSSFHAPLEISRIIANGIGIIQEGRLKLARILVQHGVNGDVPYPDISTKEKAQALIGLKMDSLKAEKKVFINTLLVDWIKKATDAGIMGKNIPVPKE